MWYDGNGNLVKERINTNEAGAPEKYNEVEYTYDNRNRITMTKSYDGEKYNYAQNYYDAKGNVIRTYTGLSEPLVINGLDDVTTTGDEEYAVTKYEYDELDRLLTTTERWDIQRATHMTITVAISKHQQTETVKALFMLMTGLIILHQNRCRTEQMQRLPFTEQQDNLFQNKTATRQLIMFTMKKDC